MKSRPVTCEKDFCDECGDCLACYGEDECINSDSGEHVWPDETYEEFLVAQGQVFEEAS